METAPLMVTSTLTRSGLRASFTHPATPNASTTSTTRTSAAIRRTTSPTEPDRPLYPARSLPPHEPRHQLPSSAPISRVTTRTRTYTSAIAAASTGITSTLPHARQARPQRAPRSPAPHDARGGRERHERPRGALHPRGRYPEPERQRHARRPRRGDELRLAELAPRHEPEAPADHANERRERDPRRVALTTEAHEHRRRQAEHRERPLPERQHPQRRVPPVGDQRREREREQRPRHRRDHRDHHAARDGPDPRPSRDVDPHLRGVALGVCARDEREEDLRHAEEELVWQKREELAGAVNGDPLVRPFRRVRAEERPASSARGSARGA